MLKFLQLQLTLVEGPHGQWNSVLHCNSNARRGIKWKWHDLVNTSHGHDGLVDPRLHKGASRWQLGKCSLGMPRSTPTRWKWTAAESDGAEPAAAPRLAAGGYKCLWNVDGGKPDPIPEWKCGVTVCVRLAGR